MIYELRIYRCMPAAGGSLRFQNYRLRIWQSHGIRQGGFWTTLIGGNCREIACMLAGDRRLGPCCGFASPALLTYLMEFAVWKVGAGAE